MHIFGLIFIILNKITIHLLDEIKADLFGNSFVKYFIYNDEWFTWRALSKSRLTSEACLCEYVCVCIQEAPLNVGPLCSVMGKSGWKVDQQGTLRQGEMLNAKGPFTVEHVISWSQALPCHRGGPGPPTSTESAPGWAMSAEERIRPSTLPALVKRAF